MSDQPGQTENDSCLKGKTAEVQVGKVSPTETVSAIDAVAVEEPMEIRIVFGPAEQRKMRSLAVTMRTPGEDRQLAIGFLFTEGIIGSASQIESIRFRGVDPDGQPTENIVRIDLRPDVPFDFSRLQRNFFTHSSCGVCGKTSLETLELDGTPPIEGADLKIASDIVMGLPEKLRNIQPTFRKTGGLHAAGLFSGKGQVLDVKEDIGRHNAVDKLVGAAVLGEKVDPGRAVMVISGRASFEIMQKAVVARVPVVIAVGAPSSLAVDMAVRYRQTLVGFASQTRFNVYSDFGRITPHRHSPQSHENQ